MLPGEILIFYALILSYSFTKLAVKKGMTLIKVCKLPKLAKKCNEYITARERDCLYKVF